MGSVAVNRDGNEKACRAALRVRNRMDSFGPPLGSCERCARWTVLTLHHRVKRGQGGAWAADNCVLVCGDGVRGCHGWIEANPDAAAVEGFHCRPWEDPASVPLLVRWDWVRLGGDGDYYPV